MTYSAVLTSNTNDLLKRHLLRKDGQEDLCFALWYPGRGAHRMSAILSEVVLPDEGNRAVHGNATINSSYLDRMTALALKRGAGIAFMHSHPYPGWQDMSRDDRNTELRMAPMAFATTGLPLVGLTLGTDGLWSARFWVKTAPRMYERNWCESVRVIGDKGLEVTYNDRLLPPPAFREELKRTISAWGEVSQQKLARLRFGVIGVGSVGSVVAESLARMGVQHIKLIDFDGVEKHNLDRLLHATVKDIGRLKVDVIGEALERNATAADPVIDKLPLAVVEESGFREALDCDILFSCVDRPWGRYVLNYIAYAYLIPVVDGGIIIRTKNTRLQQASWRMHTVYPGKKCLECVGQYNPDFVNVERQGQLDDPTYIANLPHDHTLKRNENVFSFGAHLGSSLILQMLHTALSPAGIADTGEQIYHFPNASIDTNLGEVCHENCYFREIVGRGDSVELPITGPHPAAEASRTRRRSKVSRPWWKRLLTHLIK